MSESTKEKKRVRTVERYHRLKNEGLCVSCGFRVPINGRTLCKECRELVKQNQYNRRLKLIEEERCISCGSKLENTTNLKCQTCQLKNKKKVDDYYNKNKEEINRKRREKYNKKKRGIYNVNFIISNIRRC